MSVTMGFASDITYDLLVLTIFMSILYTLQFRWKRRHIRKLASRIPGPKSLPILGNILDVLAWTKEESVQKYKGIAIKYSHQIFRFWLGQYLFIFVSDPCDLEILMNSEKCLEKEIFKNVADKYPVGDGLLMIGGEQWKIHRKIITSSFHYRHFDYFVEVFNKNSNILVKCLLEASNNSMSINILHYLTRFTFDSICKTVLSIEMKSQGKKKELYIDSMDSFISIGTKMFFEPWLLVPIIIRLTPYHKEIIESTAYMNKFCNELITKKTKEYRERIDDTIPTKIHSDSYNRKDKHSLIDSINQLIDSNKCSFSKNEIMGEVNNIIMAGMDTTATSLSFTMMLLGFHQDVQSKVQEELYAVFGDDLERSVSMDDLNNLKYTEQVIKESLRLFPAVPLMPRTSTEDIEINGYTIPKGCDVIFNFYSLHRNPKIYSNPDEFDPENFSPERSKGRHPYSFLPFSGGMRKCVGYKYAMFQMKVVLATVLRHFTVHPACDRKEMDRWDLNLVLKLVNGFKIKLVSKN